MHITAIVVISEEILTAIWQIIKRQIRYNKTCYGIGYGIDDISIINRVNKKHRSRCRFDVLTEHKKENEYKYMFSDGICCVIA